MGLFGNSAAFDKIDRDVIAIADGHVIGWHVARNETCAAWSSLLSRIAPPA